MRASPTLKCMFLCNKMMMTMLMMMMMMMMVMMMIMMIESGKMQCNVCLRYVAHVAFAYPKCTKNISFLLNTLP